ncbi:TIGR01440 family protein [Fibrobacter sp. UWR2]|uniref:TIGR01440 family protein n=1 Tax=Fibrobacter sp. UWR2 TaxID=1964352 RepID=UPI000B52491E|nr:TIGR01440 family protein [Fibrobacter sp. UWR2]OWV02317.1 TIGR01440 family protein [Fibrobacter sp. UWR2]
MAGITYEIDDKSILEQIQGDAKRIAEELVEAAHLGKGQIVVIGCSTSETLGQKLGSHSVPEAGKAIFEALQGVFAPRGIYIAAQCCEHLNRAIIIEHEAVPNADIVNVVPQPKAGGSFATACYKAFRNPVAIEHIRADAGLDIGGTLIGMHLKEVAVPLRLLQKTIGQASVIAARTRPKFIGGERAVYDERLKDGYPKF